MIVSIALDQTTAISGVFVGENGALVLFVKWLTLVGDSFDISTFIGTQELFLEACFHAPI
jgi:hypothetical protein